MKKAKVAPAKSAKKNSGKARTKSKKAQAQASSKKAISDKNRVRAIAKNIQAQVKQKHQWATVGALWVLTTLAAANKADAVCDLRPGHNGHGSPWTYPLSEACQRATNSTQCTNKAQADSTDSNGCWWT